MIGLVKKHFVIIIVILILIFGVIIVSTKDSNKNVSNSNLLNDNSVNKVPGMFAIMLETEAGSGEYEESNSSIWPGSDYIFNENMSVCENGSELSWNEELGAVNLKTNIADTCYVYFDVYIPNIFYKYDASLNSDAINNGWLLYDIQSNAADEILLMFDGYQGEFNGDARTLSKIENVSNREYSLNYGLNSLVYVNNSPLFFSNANITSYSNYSPIFYLKDSNLDARDVYIYSYQETNDILAILNNSNFDINNTSITSVNDLNVYINGTSNSFTVNSIFYEVNGEGKPLNFILNESSVLTLTNLASFSANINLNESSNIEINNSGNMTVNIDSDVVSSALIYNTTNMNGCFNSNNNSKFDINLENSGTLNLTCDSYVSVFENYTEINNINSNGYNIYYDSEKSTTISGIVDLNGGGQLIPY